MGNNNDWWEYIAHANSSGTWKNHKYIRKEGDQYIYADDKNSNGKSKTSFDLDEMVQKVVRGDFGNGAERKKLLGDNYSTIQKKVNEFIRSGKKTSTKTKKKAKNYISKKRKSSKKKTNTKKEVAKNENIASVGGEKAKMENELYHHGVLGMKWGVRRYQRKDGTLTRFGKKKYDKEIAKLKKEEQTIKNKNRTKAKLDKLEAKRKSVEELKKSSASTKADSSKPKTKSTTELSDAELRDRVNRLQLEKQYRDLSPKEVSFGKAFMNRALKSVVAPAAEEIGRQVVKSLMTKALNEHIKDEDLKIFTNNKKK